MTALAMHLRSKITHYALAASAARFWLVQLLLITAFVAAATVIGDELNVAFSSPTTGAISSPN
jgi:hypothetical protein